MRREGRPLILGTAGGYVHGSLTHLDATAVATASVGCRPPDPVDFVLDSDFDTLSSSFEVMYGIEATSDAPTGSLAVAGEMVT